MIDVKKNPSEELKKRINDVSGYRACKFVNAFTDMFHDDESLNKKDEAVIIFVRFEGQRSASHCE